MIISFKYSVLYNYFVNYWVTGVMSPSLNKVVVVSGVDMLKINLPIKFHKIKLFIT